MLLAALVLIVFGLFLVFEALGMLFQMSPFSLVVMCFGAVFVFAGIVLLVVALVGVAAA
jgi:hypothetical protein